MSALLRLRIHASKVHLLLLLYATTEEMERARPRDFRRDVGHVLSRLRHSGAIHAPDAERVLSQRSLRPRSGEKRAGLHAGRMCGRRSMHLLTAGQFRCLRENELVPGSKAGLEFTTVTINVPAYLQWLMQRFLSRGGKPVRARIMHIEQVSLPLARI